MSATYTLNELAVSYAAKLLRYNEVLVHVDKAGGRDNCLREDASALRAAYDELCSAQNELNACAEALAERNYK